jgi:hypothetical protein
MSLRLLSVDEMENILDEKHHRGLAPLVIFFSRTRGYYWGQHIELIKGLSYMTPRPLLVVTAPMEDSPELEEALGGALDIFPLSLGRTIEDKKNRALRLGALKSKIKMLGKKARLLGADSFDFYFSFAGDLSCGAELWDVIDDSLTMLNLPLADRFNGRLLLSKDRADDIAFYYKSSGVDVRLMEKIFIISGTDDIGCIPLDKSSKPKPEQSGV